jgi:hypothetical protein
VTAATAPGASTGVALAAPPRRKPKVGFGDLLALTVRQQRMTLILTVLAYVLFGLLVVLSKGRVVLGDWRFDPKTFTPAFAGLIAVFWGAPLLATEYEQRTHLLVWSQDVSAMRWLVAKLALLGGAVVVLAGLLDLVVGSQVADTYITGYSQFNPVAAFGDIGYETWPPLALAYALFGFFLGVAVGAVCRRIVAAMGFTLVGFVAIRTLINIELRPWLLGHLMAPVRAVWPMAAWGVSNPNAPAVPGPNDYLVDHLLWLGKSGQVLDFPTACEQNTASDKAFAQCMINNGVVSEGTDYQPYARLHLFQSVELGIYLVLIVVCVWLAVWSVRRVRSSG